VTIDALAADVMSSPVVSSEADTELADAIRQMLLKDVQRLFVHGQDRDRIIGILSLSDAARIRSGSCRACTSSRLMQV
jgi:predicted transcriptional regulator